MKATRRKVPPVSPLRRRYPDEPSERLRDVTLQLQRDQIRALEDRIQRLETESQAREHFLDEHPVACIELMPSSLIRRANAQAMVLLGETSERVLFEPLRSFIVADDIEHLYRHIHQCLTAGPQRPQVETDIKLAAGLKSVRLVSRSVAKTRVPQERVIPTALVDMTESRAASQLAMLEDQSFQRLVESVDGIVWEADYPFRLRFVSPQIERLLGYPASHWAREASFWDNRIHIDDRDRVLSEREAAIRAGEHYVTDYRFHSAADGVVWLRESMFVSRTAQGHTRLHGLIVNITPLKQAEAQLRQANEQIAAQAEDHRRHLEQTVQSMETFCYGIAHELRAPVRAMQGFSEILLQGEATGPDGPPRADAVPDHEQRAEYLRRIATAAARLDTLISDLLAYGRLHHTDLAVVPTAVDAVIHRVIEALSDEISTTHAMIEVAPTDARVLAHPPLFVQALQNLVSNALKFVPAGEVPCIRIHTDRIFAPSMAADFAGIIRISVRDYGVGVRPESRDQIFGLFQRAHTATEYPGTGIGLAMVKRIVELLNGRLGLDTSVQDGSCFWIELPAAPRAIT
jgi:PAS domain S-box-containing protein